MMATFYKLSH